MRRHMTNASRVRAALLSAGWVARRRGESVVTASRGDLRAAVWCGNAPDACVWHVDAPARIEWARAVPLTRMQGDNWPERLASLVEVCAGVIVGERP